MMIFWHIVAAFFFVIGLLDFILEIKKILQKKDTDGIWLLALIDKENEDKAEMILRKAGSFAENLPVVVCCKDVSEITEQICDKICDEEGFDRILPENT